MRYHIHLRSDNTAGSLLNHLDILKYLRRKNVKAELFSNKPVIRMELSNPGIITTLKKQYSNQIVGIFSDRHGAGLYKRPAHQATRVVTGDGRPKGYVTKLDSKGLFHGVAKPLTPIQVAQAYNFPKMGTNFADRTVAIIELGGGYNPQTVYDYCHSLGVKTPRLYGHNVETGSNAPDGPDGADGEVGLDIDVVAAVAPGIKILVIFAPNTTNGFIAAIQACHTYPLKPDDASLSWGAPEDSWDSAAMEVINNEIQACVNAGINVFVAAGDNGSSDGEAGAHVDFPASSPYAIACGGTKLILNSDGTRHSEVVWNEQLFGEGATGGGISTTGRKVPDIAGNADPNSGYIVDIDGQQSVIGGTSAVAPLMAALNVLLNSNLDKPVANLKDVLYANPSVCFDVVNGNNGAYSANVGYDCCTGLGVPDGQKLLKVLQPRLTSRVIKFLKRPLISFVN